MGMVIIDIDTTVGPHWLFPLVDVNFHYFPSLLLETIPLLETPLIRDPLFRDLPLIDPLVEF